MFNIVLVHPEIPPNTGNIIRLCANSGCRLHLIEPLGFSMEDRYMRRAGLDYHTYAKHQCHACWQSFLNSEKPTSSRTFALSTKGTKSVFDVQFQAEDWFIFGNETSGLPTTIQSVFSTDHQLRLPMLPKQRSLNLSNAAAITVYEAWRQIAFLGTCVN